METITSILNQQFEKLQVYEDLLQKNQLNLEQVGELSREILFYTDEDFNLRYLNKPGRDWIGLSSGKSAIKESDFKERFYHPDTLQYELPKVRNYFKNQQLGSIYSIDKNSSEIRNELFISRHTVEQHRKNIDKKLGIHRLKDILDCAFDL
jgi:hypothetical protein